MGHADAPVDRCAAITREICLNLCGGLVKAASGGASAAVVDPVPFLCAHSMTARRGARASTRAGAMRSSAVATANLDARAEAAAIMSRARVRTTTRWR